MSPRNIRSLPCLAQIGEAVHALFEVLEKLEVHTQNYREMYAVMHVGQLLFVFDEKLKKVYLTKYVRACDLGEPRYMAIVHVKNDKHKVPRRHQAAPNPT